METTTIQLRRSLMEKLKKLKIHPREPYNSVIERLIESSIDEEPLSEEEMRDIKKSLDDIKKDKVYSLGEVKKELGL